MMTNQRFGVAVSVLFCAALPVFAQAPASRAPRVQPPYTVEFKTTRVQTLANGTTITSETTEKMARDQQMRRMTSTTNSPSGDRPAITNVHVSDPATGEEINWNSNSKVARDVKWPAGYERRGCWASPDGRNHVSFAGAGSRSASGIGAIGGGEGPLQPPALPDNAGAPVASPLASSQAVPRVVHSNGGEVIPLGPGSPPSEKLANAAAALGQAPDPRNVVHEDLGADTIMGVAVHGSRTTVTTPTGAQGNDQPLVRTSEFWMAPSLGLTLRSISDDPRMGKSDREVVSLDLNNPDPALFQPPADYTVDLEQMQQVACQQ